MENMREVQWEWRTVTVTPLERDMEMRSVWATTVETKAAATMVERTFAKSRVHDYTRGLATLSLTGIGI
jgi:hypothetical protein